MLVKLMKQRLEELGEPGDVERQLRLVVPNSAIRMVIDMILEKVSLRSFPLTTKHLGANNLLR